MKKFYTKYKHGIPMLFYMVFYLIWFFYIEENMPRHYRIIHMAVDNYIPFCEVFIIPYLLWFAYVAGTVLFFLFRGPRADFVKLCAFLVTGMTLFLVISTLWPNGHHLRPVVMPRDNIFTNMIRTLYETDTSTNLWPSIHVYNSLGAHFAIAKTESLKKHPLLRFGSLTLAISIILSTVLIKQHSVFDVLTAFILAAVMYYIIYIRNFQFHFNIIKRKKPQID